VGVYVYIYIYMVRSGETKVLNVAEKPSVARALAGVFGTMPGARDRGMRREVHQIFTHESVQFVHVNAQGDGRTMHGPSE
jgi:DNA topoisomerase III